MSDIIKVKVVKMTNSTWWYGHLVGKTINVTQAEWCDYNYYFEDEKDSANAGNILKTDCVVVTTQQELQERLQQAKAAVEAVEKQLVEEAEKEANRPFTQAEYERVVAEYRACEGRVKVDLSTHNSKHCFTISDGELYANSWISVSLLPFGVAFNNENSAKNAIAKVGAENLKRAWEYEMSIGL